MPNGSFYLWTTTKYSNAQKHVGQQGHRRKPNMLVNSCLDPCSQEGGKIKNGFAFSSRCLLFQGFHRQLEICSVVWQAPLFHAVRLGMFRGCVYLGFFPCAHVTCEVCVWGCLCFLHRATQQTEKAHLGTLNTHEGSCAFFPFLYCKDFMRREENQRSKWWLKLFSDLSVLSCSKQVWVNRIGWRQVSAVCWRLLSPLVWFSLWIKKLGLSPSSRAVPEGRCWFHISLGTRDTCSSCSDWECCYLYWERQDCSSGYSMSDYGWLYKILQWL